MEKIIAHGMMKTRYQSISIELDFKLYNKFILAILGPSGSGKTTFLKYLAGLEQPDESKLIVNNQCWQDSEKGFFKPPNSRLIGYVLQEAVLFPHLSIKENILFGYKRTKKHLRKVHFHDIVSLLNLEKIIQCQPKNLSGGESQRVCIARALLPHQNY